MNTGEKENIVYTRQSIFKVGSESHEIQAKICVDKLISIGIDSSKISIYKEDKNKSGATLDRPKMKHIIEKIKQGKVDTIISYKLDRISRSLLDFVGLLSLCEKHGVKYISATESIDTTTETGRLVTKILAIFAEFERNTIRERVTDAYHNLAEQGVYLGGKVPYGYRLSDDKDDKRKFLLVEECEARQVKELFETYAIEGFTLRKVLKHMIDADMQCLKGKEWTTSKISNILRNVLYSVADKKLYDYLVKKGYTFADGLTEEQFDGTCSVKIYNFNKKSANKLVAMTKNKGFVSSDVWIKCQKKLEVNRQIGTSASNKTSWIAGLVHCGLCGHRMTTIKSHPNNDGSVKIYFNCLGRSEKRTCKGPGATVYAESLEEIVSRSINDKLKTLKTDRMILSEENQALIDECKRNIEEIKEKERRATDILLEDTDINYATKKVMNEKIAELEQQREKYNQLIDSIMEKETVMSKTINMSKKWRYAGFETKKQIANTLIKTIFIHQKGQIEIVWNV